MITNKFLNNLETQFVIEDHKELINKFKDFMQYKPQFFPQDSGKQQNIIDNIIVNFNKFKHDFSFDESILFKKIQYSAILNTPPHGTYNKKLVQDINLFYHYLSINFELIPIGGMFDKQGPKLIILVRDTESIINIHDAFTIFPKTLNYFLKN